MSRSVLLGLKTRARSASGFRPNKTRPASLLNGFKHDYKFNRYTDYRCLTQCRPFGVRVGKKTASLTTNDVQKTAKNVHINRFEIKKYLF
jgi:hypothetical protein